MNGTTLVMAIFTGFVALFTFLLWRATKKYAETTKGLLEQSKQAVEQSRLLTEVTKEYTEVTKKLLNQSEEAFKQSRIAFLVSVVDGLTEYVNQSTGKIGMGAIVSHCVGKLVAIGKIDKKVSEEIWQAMKDWGSDTKYKEFADKYEGLYRKKLG